MVLVLWLLLLRLLMLLSGVDAAALDAANACPTSDCWVGVLAVFAS